MSKYKVTLQVPVSVVIEFDPYDHGTPDDAITNAVVEAGRAAYDVASMAAERRISFGNITEVGAQVELLEGDFGVSWATPDETIYQTGYVFRTQGEAMGVLLDGPWLTMQKGDIQVDHLGYVKNGQAVYGRVERPNGDLYDTERYVGTYHELSVSMVSAEPDEVIVADVRRRLEADPTHIFDPRDLVVDVSS